MSDWLELTKEQRLWTIQNDNLDIADKPENIKCPWCNSLQGIEYEDANYTDDNYSEHTCESCDKTFEIQTCVTYDWRTRLPEEHLIEEAKKALPVAIEEKNV